jgi:hypothetical protein
METYSCPNPRVFFFLKKKRVSDDEEVWCKSLGGRGKGGVRLGDEGAENPGHLRVFQNQV